MNKFYIIAAAIAAIVSIVGLDPTPATAQGLHCGGSVGEGCYSRQERERFYDRSGLPRPQPNIRRGYTTGGPYVVGGGTKKSYANRQGGGGASWSQQTQTRRRVIERQEWHRRTTQTYTVIRRWHIHCEGGVCTKTYLETNE